MTGQSLGFLNINKPSGMTSHDVVGRVRRLLKVKQVGHGGTLDPMATGVLPVAVGSACRLLRFLPEGKCYIAEVLFGQRTTTDDIEGEVIERTDPSLLPTEQAIWLALQAFIGALDQVPPIYSAIHHQGERLYDLARRGVEIEAVPSRRVLVHSIELIGSFASSENPKLVQRVSLRIDCGGGTYIRSIARDLGAKLGCGACLSALVRERSGPFVLAKSVELQHIEQAAASGAVQQFYTSPTSVIGGTPEFPRIEVDEQLGRKIFMGQKIDSQQLPQELGSLCGDETLKILVTAGDWLLAVCKFESGILRSEVVIDHARQAS
jgi:tRNA pseudouridine55 synthase